MKGHTTFPDLQWIPEVLEPEVEAVKENVADPSSKYDSEHGVEKQVINIARLPGRAESLGAQPCQPPRASKADEVHNSIPVDLDRAELQGYRTEAGIL